MVQLRSLAYIWFRGSWAFVLALPSSPTALKAHVVHSSPRMGRLKTLYKHDGVQMRMIGQDLCEIASNECQSETE